MVESSAEPRNACRPLSLLYTVLLFLCLAHQLEMKGALGCIGHSDEIILFCYLINTLTPRIDEFRGSGGSSVVALCASLFFLFLKRQQQQQQQRKRSGLARPFCRRRYALAPPNAMGNCSGVLISNHYLFDLIFFFLSSSVYLSVVRFCEILFLFRYRLSIISDREYTVGSCVGNGSGRHLQ